MSGYSWIDIVWEQMKRSDADILADPQLGLWANYARQQRVIEPGENVWDITDHDMLNDLRYRAWLIDCKKGRMLSYYSTLTID